VLIAVFILAGTGTYIGYSLPRTCEPQAVKEASAILVIQMKQYDHLYQVATTTPRTGLDRPLVTMQQILMDTQQVTVPACLQTAKTELVHYMRAVIGAFLAYASSAADATIQDLINQSELHYDHFVIELKAVNACTPYCLPQWTRDN
jgi:hypothetical protein